MLITESFNAQLDDLLERICGKLQISPMQHEQAASRYETIGDWLGTDGSLLASANPLIYPQGSLSIGTTVKPKGRQEYDLDLVCEMQIDPRKVTNPISLLDAVESRLKQHDTYRKMLERKNRCVRVNYANEFHLDILPACPDPYAEGTCVVVPDRKAKDWKASNPKGFAAWFESHSRTFEVVKAAVEPLPEQERFELKAPLKRAVQLMKRWRDLAYEADADNAPISIVLTTLAAQHYRFQESVNETLGGILRRVIASLPKYGGRLMVLNPTNEREDLSERWDEKPRAYQAFVSGITSFAATWDEVNSARGLYQVTAILERLFGETITKSAIVEQAGSMEQLRRQQRLGIKRTSGVLTVAGGPAAEPIRPNTFHGK